MRPERISPNAVFGTANYSEIIMDPNDAIEGSYPDDYVRALDRSIFVTPDGMRVIPIEDNTSVTILCGDNGKFHDVADITPRFGVRETVVREISQVGTTSHEVATIYPGREWQGPGFVVRRPTKKP